MHTNWWAPPLSLSLSLSWLLFHHLSWRRICSPCFKSPGFVPAGQLSLPEDFLVRPLPGFYSQRDAFHHSPFCLTQSPANLSAGIQHAVAVLACHCQTAAAVVFRHSEENRQSKVCEHCPSGASPEIVHRKKQHWPITNCSYWAN